MTLTREDILQQSEGRQLDRWVQEHIMKWKPWVERRGDYLVVTFQKPDEREPYMSSRDWKSNKERYSEIEYADIDPNVHAVYGDKNWSSDISATWIVEERIKELRLGAAYIAGLKKVLLTTDEYIGMFEYVHATPEQRCKAALLAVLDL